MVGGIWACWPCCGHIIDWACVYACHTLLVKVTNTVVPAVCKLCDLCLMYIQLKFEDVLLFSCGLHPVCGHILVGHADPLIFC